MSKTVLGNKIEWDTTKIPSTKSKKGSFSGKDDQLWRCRKTKRFEASLLSSLPYGSFFVDAGAHFGDTVITMALYARDTLGRHDLRFVAIEPNHIKAKFIQETAKANGFDTKTLKVISCVLGNETLMGGAKARKNDEWCKYDGRTSYIKTAQLIEEVTDVVVDAVPPAVETSCKHKKKKIDDEESCSSSSSSSSRSSAQQLLDMHQLDDFYDIIHPIGFLHIDVEGWEAKVLTSATKLLTLSDEEAADDGPPPCFILAEIFHRKEAQRRGPEFSLTHEEDVVEAMRNLPIFVRGEDVIDGERNLFFSRGTKKGCHVTCTNT